MLCLRSWAVSDPGKYMGWYSRDGSLVCLGV